MRQAPAALMMMLAAGGAEATPRVVLKDVPPTPSLEERVRKKLPRYNPCTEALEAFSMHDGQTVMKLGHAKFHVGVNPFGMDVSFVYGKQQRLLHVPLEKRHFLGSPEDPSAMTILGLDRKRGHLITIAYHSMVMNTSLTPEPVTRVAVLRPNFARGVCQTVVDAPMPEPLAPAVAAGEQVAPATPGVLGR